MIFETHAHYDDEKFEMDREEIIKSAYNSGVTKIISAGYSLEGSKRSIELSDKYPFIYSTAGISPNDINENFEQEIDEIDQILFNIFGEKGKPAKKIVAVGEIGLDYHYDTDKEKQKIAFIKQIHIANKYNLPIVIHTREAVMDTIQILKENQVNRRGVFHCCPFNRELVKEALKLGFYISIAGPVTFKNSKNAPEIIDMIPIDRMLIETDSPYLAPEPVRGTRNDSRNVKYTAQKIAELKGLTIEEVAEATYRNAEKLYNIEE